MIVIDAGKRRSVLFWVRTNSVRLVSPRKTRKRTSVRHGMGLGNSVLLFSATNRPIQNVSALGLDIRQRRTRRPCSCCFQSPANAGFCVFRGLSLTKVDHTRAAEPRKSCKPCNAKIWYNIPNRCFSAKIQRNVQGEYCDGKTKMPVLRRRNGIIRFK